MVCGGNAGMVNGCAQNGAHVVCNFLLCTRYVRLSIQPEIKDAFSRSHVSSAQPFHRGFCAI